MNIRPLRIESQGRHLAATRYGDGPKALVVLPPLAEERKGCVRPLAELARRMAVSSWSTFLFDYTGTGESPGDFEEVRLPRILRNADDVTACAMQFAGAEKVVLLGVRVGARLALELARQRPERITGVCLWEPILDLRSWLRDLRRRSRFRGGGAVSDPLDIDGYRFSDGLAQDIESMVPWTGGVEPPVTAFVNERTASSREQRELAPGLHAPVVPCFREAFWLESDLPDLSELLRETALGLQEIRGDGR